MKEGKWRRLFKPRENKQKDANNSNNKKEFEISKYVNITQAMESVNKKIETLKV